MLTILQEAFPAVAAAETAVKLRPLWWEGWQTLGRAQLNLGEVDLVSPAVAVAAAAITEGRRRQRPDRFKQTWSPACFDSNVASPFHWLFRASPAIGPFVRAFQSFLRFQLSCFGKPVFTALCLPWD